MTGLKFIGPVRQQTAPRHRRAEAAVRVTLQLFERGSCL